MSDTTLFFGGQAIAMPDPDRLQMADGEKPEELPTFGNKELPAFSLDDPAVSDVEELYGDSPNQEAKAQAIVEQGARPLPVENPMVPVPQGPHSRPAAQPKRRVARPGATRAELLKAYGDGRVAPAQARPVVRVDPAYSLSETGVDKDVYGLTRENFTRAIQSQPDDYDVRADPRIQGVDDEGWEDDEQDGRMFGIGEPAMVEPDALGSWRALDFLEKAAWAASPVRDITMPPPDAISRRSLDKAVAAIKAMGLRPMSRAQVIQAARANHKSAVKYAWWVRKSGGFWGPGDPALVPLARKLGTLVGQPNAYYFTRRLMALVRGLIKAGYTTKTGDALGRELSKTFRFFRDRKQMLASMPGWRPPAMGSAWSSREKARSVSDTRTSRALNMRYGAAYPDWRRLFPYALFHTVALMPAAISLSFKSGHVPAIWEPRTSKKYPWGQTIPKSHHETMKTRGARVRPRTVFTPANLRKMTFVVHKKGGAQLLDGAWKAPNVDYIAVLGPVVGANMHRRNVDQLKAAFRRNRRGISAPTLQDAATATRLIERAEGAKHPAVTSAKRPVRRVARKKTAARGVARKVGGGASKVTIAMIRKNPKMAWLAIPSAEREKGRSLVQEAFQLALREIRLAAKGGKDVTIPTSQSGALMWGLALIRTTKARNPELEAKAAKGLKSKGRALFKGKTSFVKRVLATSRVKLERRRRIAEAKVRRAAEARAQAQQEQQQAAAAGDSAGASAAQQQIAALEAELAAAQQQQQQAAQQEQQVAQMEQQVNTVAAAQDAAAAGGGPVDAQAQDDMEAFFQQQGLTKNSSQGADPLQAAIAAAAAGAAGGGNIVGSAAILADAAAEAKDELESSGVPMDEAGAFADELAEGALDETKSMGKSKGALWVVAAAAAFFMMRRKKPGAGPTIKIGR
jgi:hypothetical protein